MIPNLLDRSLGGREVYQVEVLQRSDVDKESTVYIHGGIVHYFTTCYDIT